MIIHNVFWLILGIGIAVPFTLVCIINLVTKILSGDQYQLDLKKLGVVYIIAILGYAITFGVR